MNSRNSENNKFLKNLPRLKPRPAGEILDNINVVSPEELKRQSEPSISKLKADNSEETSAPNKTHRITRSSKDKPTFFSGPQIDRLAAYLEFIEGQEKGPLMPGLSEFDRSKVPDAALHRPIIRTTRDGKTTINILSPRTMERQRDNHGTER